MKEWSPRLVTKASLEPSGDHSGEPQSPRAKKSRLVGVEPSSGAAQSPRSFVNTTRSLFGEISGSSPSPRSFGSPPLNGALHTCTFICVGPFAGFTPTELSKFEP